MTTSTSTRLGVVEEVTSGKCDMPDITAAQKESLGRGHFLFTNPTGSQSCRYRCR
jgi:hypothetical protein